MSTLRRAFLLGMQLLLAAAAGQRKNVLFLICDDLRPQLNHAYGQKFMHTPNFDKLAKSALTFDYAYTNMAICSASRNSFLTGRLPDNTRTWNFIDHFRSSGMSTSGQKGANWTTWPEHFKNSGYRVYGHGKLYHPNRPPANDEPLSWSQDRKYVPLSTHGCSGKERGGTRYCPGTSSDNSSYSDYVMVSHALDTLKVVAADYKENGTNFWMGVGVHYPHQPWYTPEWTEKQYPPATQLAAPKHPYAPKNIPAVAFTAELDGKINLALNEDLPGFANSKPENVSGKVEYDCPSPGNNTVPMYVQQQLRLGYYTAVTLSDSNMGRVLDLLDELGIANDTLVILTGDHGWQLGEHAEWGKHSNLELAVQVPLLMRAPWTASGGKHTQSFTELVDLYRTVAALAGVPEPEADVGGTDVSALLEQPDQILKQVAYAQYSRCPGDRMWPTRQPGHPDWFLNNCEKVPAQNISYMGYSVRTAEWRFTEWYPWIGGSCVADFDKPYATELYSHQGQQPHPLDFDAWENENVGKEPGNAKVLAHHRSLLLAKFRTGASWGCPGTPAPSPPPGGPTVIPDRALVQLRATKSGQHWDNSLCPSEECLSKRGGKFNYTEVATEGYMPSEGTEGTIQLFQYWSSKSADNFLSTAKPPEGYSTPGRLNPAGLVFKDRPTWLSADTAPLQVWYNAKKKDHLTAALPSTVHWAKSNGYVLLDDAIGYVYTEPQSDAALEMWWDPRVSATFV